MSVENNVSVEDKEFRCPHFKEVDKETLLQLFSEVAAIRSENRELFDFTHRPIKVFESSQAGGDESIVSEEEVYNKFANERAGNFAVVIEGEVGTGKSELCAYLAHRLEAEADRPILHVDKDDDLMTLLSERIPQFYEEEVGDTLPDAANFKQLKTDLEENGTVVANNASSGAILNLSQNYDVDAQGKEEKIREYIQEQLFLLVEKGDYAREIKFITEEAYRRKNYLQIIDEDIDESDAADAFNQELWKTIRTRYETASLNKVLEKVGKKFTNRRPVIIFEDFAITAMEAEQLRNYMERDKSSDNWDFIVAGTRDATQVLHTRTAEDRFKFFRTNRRDSNSVLFLDEENAVDFIRPYLGYFKYTTDGSVTYDRSDDGLELELNKISEDSICGECGLCDESFRDLFPFNEPFLERMYAGLRDDEKSPREYVMAVFDVLRDYYDGYLDAPSEGSRLSTMRNQIDPATEVYEDAEKIANLACWYGEPVTDGIKIDVRFVQAFQLDTEVDKINEIEEEDDYIIVPTDIETQVVTGVDDDEIIDGPPVEQESKAERLIKEYRPNVRPWQQNPEDFPEIGRYIRIALRDAIQQLTNDFKLFDGMNLRYNLSSQQDPFILKSHSMSPDDDQIIIDPVAFRVSDLRELLEFGIYRDENRSEADDEELFKNQGTQLTDYAIQWQEQIIDKNLRQQYKLFRSAEKYEFEDFVLAGYTTVVLLDSPRSKLNAEAIADRYSTGESYTLAQGLESQLKAELKPDDFKAVETFISDGQWYEEMLGALFGATADTLDVAAIRQRLDDAPPQRVLEGLGRTHINRISSRLRFDTNNKIQSIANNAYDVRKALEEIKGEYRSDVVSVFTEELSSIELSEINDIVESLSTYDSADAEMIESLNKFVALEQTDINQAVKAAKLASELTSGIHLEVIQGTLVSMMLQESLIHNRYEDITIVSGGTTGQFANEFRRIGEYYVK